MVTEPLDGERSTTLIRRIAMDGDVAWTHATGDLAPNAMSSLDCLNVMRCGSVKVPPELHEGCWRYRIQTSNMCVLVTFRSDTEIVVVRAWRQKR